MKCICLKVLLTAILLISLKLFAQDTIPEKFRNIKDTAEISNLLKEIKKIQHSNPDSCIYLINIAEWLSKKANSKSHLMRAMIFRGSYYLERGEFNEAVELYMASNEIAKELKNDYYIALSNIAISSAYLYKAYYPLSEKYLIEALSYYEKMGNHEGIGNVYLNRTFIKIEQKDFETALKFSELAYENYTISENLVGIARALANLCDIQYKLKNYPQAIRFGKMALIAAENSNQMSLNALIYMNLGENYSALNKTDSAVYYFNQSINSGKRWDDKYVLAKCKLGIAHIYAKKKDFRAAVINASVAYKLSDEGILPSTKAEAAELLANYYSNLGDYRQAFLYQNIKSIINDSLFTKEKYKATNEIEAIYQSQKKEATIARLASEKEIEMLKNKQSKYYIILLFIILVVMSFSGILYFRNTRLNAQRKTIELEQRLFRTQMNPHFIFNAISCIQDFIMDKNPLEASSYLSNFAKLMRSILNNSSREFISLEEEIDTLEHYLKLQKLRFPDKLEYEIIVQDNLEIEDLLIPPMLSQPFIENAVNHGIAKLKDGKGVLKVEFFEQNDSLFLKIEDNGIGLNNSVEQKDRKYQSMSTKITESRIANFKKSYKKRVHFEIANMVNAESKITGVEVLFQLPQLGQAKAKLEN